MPGPWRRSAAVATTPASPCGESGSRDDHRSLPAGLETADSSAYHGKLVGAEFDGINAPAGNEAVTTAPYFHPVIEKPTRQDGDAGDFGEWAAGYQAGSTVASSSKRLRIWAGTCLRWTMTV